MQHLEVSDAVRHIYIYVIRRLKVKNNTQISNFINIHPMGADLFHAEGRTDRQTDMTKSIVSFFNFVKAPTNQ